MKYLKSILLLLLTLIYGCNTDNFEDEWINEEPNKIDLKVNDIAPVHLIRNLTATLCCEDQITVSFDHWVKNPNNLMSGGSAFNLMIDRQGNLLSLWYKDYIHPNNEYRSADFTPVTSLKIEDFEFVEDQILKLKVIGQIFQRTTNFYEEPVPTDIEADIEIKSFSKCTCNSGNNSVSNIDNMIFLPAVRSQQGEVITYSIFSNSGYYLEFANFKNFISNMPVGVYVFDEDSASPRIDFMKFIGVPKFFHSSIIPVEWLQYETSGSFEITKSQTSTLVKFDLIATENGEVVYELKNALFETSW
ncbi:hypothetical protein ACFOUP_18585 [Belliella kenyensis]|uniref:Uncharacterized protein n=1 Tax=Belliella kenyensis TaxID=1472724 RepID=A0ABV8ETR4_9BACT|nr:hypothetical protein [Belliella kenyensis]MCH7402215.1 hypothetical protein [Belliella kenyensis]MDN3601729.1 hypothetical protein [Belliella kenyensis]